METNDFKSIYVSNEINLTDIAKHFGINKKFNWEEPLILTDSHLTGILTQTENKTVYIFHFGSITCINLQYHEIVDVIDYLKRIDTNLKNNTPYEYKETFTVIVDETKDYELNYNSVIIHEYKKFYIDIISIVLAKSVALEKNERDIDKLLDEIENVIGFLDKGRLHFKDIKLAKLSGKILRFKYNSLSYLMLLDKPAVAWNNETAEDFFMKTSELFELSDRYEKIRHKTETLLDITEVFTSLAHAKRGTKLEWMVIILILIEIVMSLIEKILR